MSEMFLKIQADLRKYIQTDDVRYLKSVDQKLRLLLVPYELKECKMEYDSSYYKKDGYQVIDVIQQTVALDYDNFYLGFKCYLVGNIIKYVGRYKDKHDDLQEQCNDLLKACECLSKLSKVY